MSAKKARRWNTRTILIVLLIILIAAAVSLYILNLEEPPKYYDPEDLLNNPDSFIGETVTVEGYYHDEGYITSQPTVLEGSKTLDLNYSSVNITLVEGREYRFTGKLVLDENPSAPYDVIFIAEKIKEK